MRTLILTSLLLLASTANAESYRYVRPNPNGPAASSYGRHIYTYRTRVQITPRVAAVPYHGGFQLQYTYPTRVYNGGYQGTGFLYNPYVK